MEERTHTQIQTVRMSRLVQKQVKRTLDTFGVHPFGGDLDALTNLWRRAALQLFQAAGQQPAMAPENKNHVRLHMLCRVAAIQLRFVL